MTRETPVIVTRSPGEGCGVCGSEVVVWGGREKERGRGGDRKKGVMNYSSRGGR